MALRIRLSRVGKRHAPFYRIIATDARNKRDGYAHNILGTYDPRARKLIQFHQEKLDELVRQGASLSATVRRLCKQHKRSAV